MGSFINHVDRAGGRGVFEKSTCQNTMFVHKGGGGSKMSKNLSTWFMNDPYPWYLGLQNIHRGLKI